MTAAGMITRSFYRQHCALPPDPRHPGLRRMPRGHEVTGPPHGSSGARGPYHIRRQHTCLPPNPEW